MPCSLKKALLTDIEKIGIDTSNFTLMLEPYHETKDGLYNFEEYCMTVFYLQEWNKFRPYEAILESVIHEIAHFLTDVDPTIIYPDDVDDEAYHDIHFEERYNALYAKAERLGLFVKNRMVVRNLDEVFCARKAREIIRITKLNGFNCVYVRPVRVVRHSYS